MKYAEQLICQKSSNIGQTLERTLSVFVFVCSLPKDSWLSFGHLACFASRIRPVGVHCAWTLEVCGNRLHNLPTTMHGNPSTFYIKVGLISQLHSFHSVSVAQFHGSDVLSRVGSSCKRKTSEAICVRAFVSARCENTSGSTSSLVDSGLSRSENREIVCFRPRKTRTSGKCEIFEENSLEINKKWFLRPLLCESALNGKARRKFRKEMTNRWIPTDKKRGNLRGKSWFFSAVLNYTFRIITEDVAVFRHSFLGA